MYDCKRQKGIFKRNVHIWISFYAWKPLTEYAMGLAALPLYNGYA
jgi:hypothetical protein